jgi:hypothetical protein
MGGRGRSRTQRRHFKQSRENVWKRPKSDLSSSDNNNNENDKPNWQPFATQNPAFDEYYKVLLPSILGYAFTSRFWELVYIIFYNFIYLFFKLGFGDYVFFGGNMKVFFILFLNLLDGRSKR